MTRILDLQKMEASAATDVAAAGGGSTSSWIGCSCSTNSNTGCTPQEEIIVL